MATDLTAREREVAEEIARHGASNRDIARLLGISTQTVKNHVTSIYNKLGCAQRVQIATTAYKEGWVDLDDVYVPHPWEDYYQY